MPLRTLYPRFLVLLPSLFKLLAHFRSLPFLSLALLKTQKLLTSTKPMSRNALLLFLGAWSIYADKVFVSMNHGGYVGTTSPTASTAALTCASIIPAATNCTRSSAVSVSTITARDCGDASSASCTGWVCRLFSPPLTPCFSHDSVQPADRVKTTLPPSFSGHVVVEQVTVTIFPAAPADCPSCTYGAPVTVTRTLWHATPTKLATIYPAPSNCTSTRAVAGSTGVPGCPGCSAGDSHALPYTPSSGADMRALLNGFLALMGLALGAATLL